MDVLNQLAEGMQLALSQENLLFCLAGVTLGTLVGMLPGIGAIAAVSLLLPLTFHLPTTGAMVMLAGIYYGSEYGGSISSIMLNLPGTPSAIVTCLDGYPMAQQGRAGVALALTAIASFVGALIGITVMVVAAPLIVGVATRFGAAEYFALMLLGLVLSVFVNDHGALRGAAMILAGILVGLIGVDINTGTVRFTGGFGYLRDGVDLVVFAMGIFGVSEVIRALGLPAASVRGAGLGIRQLLPGADDLKRSLGPVLRGGIIGSFFGSLPGTGPTIASFVAYGAEKRMSRSPERFGKGAVEGVVAPECANNAAAQTAFIPTLTLGLPGSATMAVMLGALMVHGITPGPTIVAEQPELFWGLVCSFLIGNLMLLVLNLPMIRLWVSLLRIPAAFMLPIVSSLICLGVYSLNNNPQDILAVLVFGLVGGVLRQNRYPLAPLIMGFVLGPLLEEHFRRAMLISDGDLLYLAHSPISAVLLTLALVLILLSVIGFLRPLGGQVARLSRRKKA